MALSKSITNEMGVVTTYHKIQNVSLYESDLHCMLNSYVSKDYRKLNKPAENATFNFPITVEEEESMGIRALCYKKIKELDEWSDAVDC